MPGTGMRTLSGIQPQKRCGARKYIAVSFATAKSLREAKRCWQYANSPSLWSLAEEVNLPPSSRASMSLQRTRILIKDFTLTFNNGFHAKTIDVQVSLNR